MLRFLRYSRRGRAIIGLGAVVVLGSCSSERQDIHTGTELEVRAPLAQPVTHSMLARAGASTVPFTSPVTTYGRVDAARWYLHIGERLAPEAHLGLTFEIASGKLVQALGSIARLSHVETDGPEVTPLAHGWIRVDERHLEDPVGFGAELELTTTDGVVISGTVTPADNDRPDAGPDAAP